jgi:hypothetical protein
MQDTSADESHDHPTNEQLNEESLEKVQDGRITPHSAQDMEEPVERVSGRVSPVGEQPEKAESGRTSPNETKLNEEEKPKSGRTSPANAQPIEDSIEKTKSGRTSPEQSKLSKSRNGSQLLSKRSLGSRGSIQRIASKQSLANSKGLEETAPQRTDNEQSITDNPLIKEAQYTDESNIDGANSWGEVTEESPKDVPSNVSELPETDQTGSHPNQTESIDSQRDDEPNNQTSASEDTHQDPSTENLSRSKNSIIRGSSKLLSKSGATSRHMSVAKIQPERVPLPPSVAGSVSFSTASLNQKRSTEPATRKSRTNLTKSMTLSRASVRMGPASQSDLKGKSSRATSVQNVKSSASVTNSSNASLKKSESRQIAKS